MSTRGRALNLSLLSPWFSTPNNCDNVFVLAAGDDVSLCIFTVEFFSDVSMCDARAGEPMRPLLSTGASGEVLATLALSAPDDITLKGFIVFGFPFLGYPAFLSERQPQHLASPGPCARLEFFYTTGCLYEAIQPAIAALEGRVDSSCPAEAGLMPAAPDSPGLKIS